MAGNEAQIILGVTAIGLAFWLSKKKKTSGNGGNGNGGITPTLAITNPGKIVWQGTKVTFWLSGWPASSRVWVGIVGGGGGYFDTNIAGVGPGELALTEPAGNYQLEAILGTSRDTDNFTIMNFTTDGFYIQPNWGAWASAAYWQAKFNGYISPNGLVISSPWIVNTYVGTVTTDFEVWVFREGDPPGTIGTLLTHLVFSDTTIQNGRAYMVDSYGIYDVGAKT